MTEENKKNEELEEKRRKPRERGMQTRSRNYKNKKEEKTAKIEVEVEKAKRPRRRKTTENSIFKKSNLKIIPLGGLHEIGKNITVFEYEDEMIIVDCGLSFPEDDMLGVDIVIPDTTYLEKNRKEKWTSKIIKKIEKHKFLASVLSVIIMCAITNFFLIYNFVCIIGKMN